MPHCEHTKKGALPLAPSSCALFSSASRFARSRSINTSCSRDTTCQSLVVLSGRRGPTRHPSVVEVDDAAKTPAVVCHRSTFNKWTRSWIGTSTETRSDDSSTPSIGGEAISTAAMMWNRFFRYTIYRTYARRVCVLCVRVCAAKRKEKKRGARRLIGGYDTEG